MRGGERMDGLERSLEQQDLLREVDRAINHANGSNYPLLSSAPISEEVVINEGYHIDFVLHNGNKYRLILEQRT
jgi:hypothetical protein